MELGEPARKGIKGHDLDYYLNILKETREQTLAEFRKRDDDWLLSVDKTWAWGPTNNYCKWFHVCEHESNHNGQIKFLKKRIPGAKPIANKRISSCTGRALRDDAGVHPYNSSGGVRRESPARACLRCWVSFSLVQLRRARFPTARSMPSSPR